MTVTVPNTQERALSRIYCGAAFEQIIWIRREKMVLNNFCSVQSEDDASKMVISPLGTELLILILYEQRKKMRFTVVEKKETTTVHTASAFASVHKNIDLSLQIQTGTNNIQHFLTFHLVYIGSGLSLGPNVNSAVHFVMQVKWRSDMSGQLWHFVTTRCGKKSWMPQN